MHQEDGCQATATPPGLKYQEQGGPALRDLADVIRDFGDPRDVTSLLRRTTFSMAVGNADAHAKNFSILHAPGSGSAEADDAGRLLYLVRLTTPDACYTWSGNA